MPSSYYCELKDIADAFEKLLDVEYIYTLKSKSSETGTKEVQTIYSTVSIISPGDDYSRGQREECMLIKKKFLKKNTTETLFIHPSYFKNHLELADTEQEYINKTPELKAILENKND